MQLVQFSRSSLGPRTSCSALWPPIPTLLKTSLHPFHSGRFIRETAQQLQSNMGCGSSVPPALPASPPKHRASFDAVAPAPAAEPAAEPTPATATDAAPPPVSNEPAEAEAGTGCTLRLICVNDVYEMDHMPRLKTAIQVRHA